MSEQFNIILCCECELYQVHQVKKSNKWSCKVCGFKQSIKKVYGVGSAPDCRRHVQKLNMLRGQQISATDIYEPKTVPSVKINNYSERDTEYEQDDENFQCTTQNLRKSLHRSKRSYEQINKATYHETDSSHWSAKKPDWKTSEKLITVNDGCKLDEVESSCEEVDYTNSRSENMNDYTTPSKISNTRLQTANDIYNDFKSSNKKSEPNLKPRPGTNNGVSMMKKKAGFQFIAKAAEQLKQSSTESITYKNTIDLVQDSFSFDI